MDFGKGCFVDDCQGEGCVFDGYDNMVVSDCDVAIKLQKKSKGRDDCPYWLDIPETVRAKVTCPLCGHEFHT